METVHTPNVFINPQNMIPSSPAKKFNVKYIFIALGVVVAIEVVFGIKTLLQPAKTALPVQPAVLPAPVVGQSAPVQQSPAGKISLSSSQKVYKPGDTIPVNINIDTGGQKTDGVDVLLKYDTGILEASSSSVIKGTLFPEYPVIKVENGIVRITAISSLQGGEFNGSGSYGTVNFKAITKGTARFLIDFTPGSTVDSNIVGAALGGDILQSVDNLEVIIK